MKAFPCYRSSGSRPLAVRRLAVKLTVHDVGYQNFGCRIHKKDIKCLFTNFSQWNASITEILYFAFGINDHDFSVHGNVLLFAWY